MGEGQEKEFRLELKLLIKLVFYRLLAPFLKEDFQ
jgi:hypothetical protein